MPASLLSKMFRLLILSAFVVQLVPVAAQENEPKPIKKREPTTFIRVQEDEFQNPLALQTATAKYVLKDATGEVELELFLESAVHIGDAAYYRGFNRRFQHYDVVLYELIAAPEQQVPDPNNGSPHPAKLLQQLVGDSLGFKHQIDQIDYKAANMVHSDLTPAEMEAAKRQRGDGDFVLLADVLVDLLRQATEDGQDQSTDSPLPLSLDVLSDPDGGIKVRRMLATAFSNSGSPESLLHPSQMRSLIKDRNERVMDVLQQQIDKGHRRIALFWGAAHMPDLERRLMLGYGVQPDGVMWRNAWDLREGAVERAPLQNVLEKTLRGVLNDALDDLFDERRKR